jgi:hypothetical protein
VVPLGHTVPFPEGCNLHEIVFRSIRERIMIEMEIAIYKTVNKYRILWRSRLEDPS